MAKLRRLINGQNVRFDCHVAASMHFSWRDLHMEKILHDGGKIRYPFLGLAPISSDGPVSIATEKRVTREVRKTLRKDPGLTRALADTIVAELRRFSANTATVESVTLAARKIAGYFDLDEHFVNQTITRARDVITRQVTIHRIPGSKVLERIDMSKEAVVVEKVEDCGTTASISSHKQTYNTQSANLTQSAPEETGTEIEDDEDRSTNHVEASN